MPIGVSYLGVWDGRVVHHFGVENNTWVRESDFHVPEGAESLHFNKNKIGVVRAGRIHFYENDEETGNIPFPKLEPGDVIVNNINSTEMELLVVGPSRSVLFDQDGEHAVSRHDKVLSANIDCVFDIINGLAVVGEGQVRFYVFERSKEHPLSNLKLRPELTYTVPEGTDEVTVLAYRYLGIRHGSKLRFVTYDAKRKIWSATSRFPDLDLDDLVNLSLSQNAKANTNVVERDGLYYLYQDDKPLTAGYDMMMVDDRHSNLVHAKKGNLRGILNAHTGKIVLPVEYAAIGDFSYEGDYDGNLTGLAERNGELFVVTLSGAQLARESPAPKNLPYVVLPPSLRQPPTKSEGRLNGIYVPASYPDLLSAWEAWKRHELREPGQPAIAVQGDIAYVSFGLFMDLSIPLMPNTLRACQTRSGLVLRDLAQADGCSSKEPPLFRFQSNSDRSLHCIECSLPEKWIPIPPVTHSFVGIGVRLKKDEDASAATIVEVIPKGPAAQAKLLPGDLLVKVDGESIATWPSARIPERIRGEAGTSVTLDVVRGARQFTVTIVRRSLDIREDAAK